jgi:hypothetical protein
MNALNQFKRNVPPVKNLNFAESSEDFPGLKLARENTARYEKSRRGKALLEKIRAGNSQHKGLTDAELVTRLNAKDA